MADEMREALIRLRDHCARADLFADAVKQADAALAAQAEQSNVDRAEKPKPEPKS